MSRRQSATTVFSHPYCLLHALPPLPPLVLPPSTPKTLFHSLSGVSGCKDDWSTVPTISISCRYLASCTHETNSHWRKYVEAGSNLGFLREPPFNMYENDNMHRTRAPPRERTLYVQKVQRWCLVLGGKSSGAASDVWPDGGRGWF